MSPENVGGSAQVVLLLLAALRAHAVLDHAEQRLHQPENQRTAALFIQKDLHHIQNLKTPVSQEMSIMCQTELRSVKSPEL